MNALPFPEQKSVLTVIHCESSEQALENTKVAVECGCDGAFLINHSISKKTLLAVHRCVRAEFPDFWLGANFLGMTAVDTFHTLPLDGIDGIWADNAKIDERCESQPEAEAVQAAIRESGWTGSYFGGVAFKYQRDVDDLAHAAKIASSYMDVVCTSGPGTGKAASTDKVRAMKEAIGDNVPLAVASGVTPDNVHHFLPWVDILLVATGISRSFTQLDPELVRSLVSNTRTYERQA